MNISVHNRLFNYASYIRGLDTLGIFSAILYKGDNFYVFLVASPSEKGPTLKGKNLSPSEQSMFFSNRKECFTVTWAKPCENVAQCMHGQRRPRSGHSMSAPRIIGY